MKNNVANNKMVKYQEINWQLCQQKLRILQENLVKAHRADENRKVKNLQRQIVTSFAARALAVRRVTTNKGSKTCGVDGKLWKTPMERSKAIKELHLLTQNPNMYRASPVRQVLIPKRKHEQRILGIPTLIDRAMQAVYLYSIDPIVEDCSDLNSYGFRLYRGAPEAMAKIRNIVGKDYSPHWILDADIEKCFDKINHAWLLKNVPIVDKSVLQSWLRSGVGTLSDTAAPEEGVPQGGIISPVLSNIALNGIEAHVQKQTKHMVTKRQRTKVYLIRYADDFIITAATEEILKAARANAEEFLLCCGLKLHPEKTRMLNMTDGSPLQYLGFECSKKPLNTKLNMPSKKNLTKFRLVIRPSKSSVQRFKNKIKKKLTTGKPMAAIIKDLNPILRGWSNYFRIARHSPKTFKTLSNWLWFKVLKWAQKKHPTRNIKWIKKKYISKSKWRTNHWCDKETHAREKVNKRTLYLLDISTVTHKFVSTIAKGLNPYLEVDREALDKRAIKQTQQGKRSLRQTLIKRDSGICSVCEASILETEEDTELHHIIPIKDGGNWKLNNLVLLHRNCHRNLNQDQNQKLKDLYQSAEPVMI